ncbi:MAG: hypothetical protein HOI23_09780 [Deltaproteobacteria bacterium]|jgi:hypothetical protein|nr:hypothetical protein [Deltaproteobacteria bacterium]MBT6489454.1 hypothetical protein [Deltaproteobacteria bacterium]
MTSSAEAARELLDIVSSEFQLALEESGGSLSSQQVLAVISNLKQRRAFSDAPTILSPLATLQTPFEVVLASRFLHLFANPDGRSLQDGGLSPRMLPGFFKVVRMMIGGPKYDAYQEECQQIETELRGENSALSTSNLITEIRQDQRTRQVALLVYARMGLWFTQFKKRKEWFISIINGTLAPLPEGPIEADEENWNFKSSHFTELFTVLFLEDVIVTMLNQSSHEVLINEFGPNAIFQLQAMISSLSRDMDQYFCGLE